MELYDFNDSIDETSVQSKITYPEPIQLEPCPRKGDIERMFKCKVYQITNAKTHHHLKLDRYGKWKLKSNHRYMMTTSMGWFLIEGYQITKSCRWDYIKRVKQRKG